MKIPKKIYLQISKENTEGDDITWCDERINDADIVYYRKSKKNET